MALSHDLDVANVFVVAFFLALYFITSVQAVRWLFFKDQGWKLRRRIDWILATLTVVIFGCITTKAAVLLRATMIAVVSEATSQTENAYGPVGHPSDGRWVYMVECVTASLPILLSDAIFIYRLWLVYDKSYRVIVFPAFLWLGALVCSILETIWESIQAGDFHSSWHIANMSVGLGTLLTPFWGTTMVLNIYATVMVCRRIWIMTKRMEGVTATRSLKFIMAVFIESGCLYVFVAMSHFIIWWTPNSYAISFVDTMNTPTTGIAFNLITTRTYQNRAREKMEASHRPHASTIHFDLPTNMQQTSSQSSHSEGALDAQRNFGTESTLGTSNKEIA